MSTILIVDDSKTIHTILRQILTKKSYDIVEAYNGIEAIKEYELSKPDLVLLDIQMPEIDGFEVCKMIREVSGEDSKYIPIIFLSSVTSYEQRQKAFISGGDDFISKPIDEIELIMRVESHIHKSKQLRKERDNLISVISGHEDTLKIFQDLLNDNKKETLIMIMDMIESRSSETGYHVYKVSKYTKLIASAYGFPEGETSTLEEASILHDIGKIGISDSILSKPGTLTDEERLIMKTHSEKGWEILKNSKQSSFRFGAIVAHSHHEDWNGSGYPQGAKEAHIPLEGRIVACADVFDALSEERVYKPAWDFDKILDFFKKQKEQKFDPKLVDIILDNKNLMHNIYMEKRKNT